MILVHLAVAINRPNFCPSTTWYPNAITFANVSTVGVEPFGVFIDGNNTIYVPNRQWRSFTFGTKTMLTQTELLQVV